MKQTLLTFLLTLLPLMASADAVEINGIFYNIVSKAKIAEVTRNPNGFYAGSIIVPATIIYNGEEYSVTSIGTYTFGSCENLTSVTIPNSVTSIGDYGFQDCCNLTSVTIPNSVTSMGVGVFRGCSSLTFVNIPNNVTSIAQYAFYDCRSLISITIPDKVKDIGDYAFRYCETLTSLTIGNGVTNIGKDAFVNCYRLTSVHISDIAAWCKIAYPFHSYHLYLGEEEIKDLVIPNNVTSIAKYAFNGCTSLTSVTIPNSVTTIGENAFGNCSSLTSVTIPNSVTNIAYGTFWDCTGLTSVTIPNSVTSIGGNAFKGCSSLTTVTIPNSVTSIESCAFSGCIGLKVVTLGNGINSIYSKSFESCRELTDVYCFAEDVPSMVVIEGWYVRECTDAFQDSYIEYSTLHVPDASINLYKSTAPWSGFGTIVGIDGSVPVTQKCATPTINYADGKLSFSCETEDVEFVSEITSADFNKFNSKDVSLTGKYTVTVYATKAGYDDSDTATKEIDISGGAGSGVPGDVNGDGVVDAADVVKVTNIIMGAE